MVATNIWFWIGFVAFVLAMLSIDLGVFNRTPHVVKAKEALTWTAIWVGLALVFAAGLAVFADHQSALTFLTGYVIEESLSVDNIFVIVLIFQYFAVPAQYQHRVLFWGILGALIMRGIFIGLGAALLARFEWIIYLFGALLVITGIRMALKGDEEFDGEQNPIVKFVRRFLPLTDGYRGKHFVTIDNGRRVFTPLLLVLLLVEATDLIFAVDSIPAIFGITRDPFLVFTSNIFAVLGLRSLFFLLASVVTKFHLLKYGLSIILTFVGAKMLLETWIHIPILLSLGIVITVLAASIAASLVWPATPVVEKKTGSMFGR
jgi:tellurite resistance protein TerC